MKKDIYTIGHSNHTINYFISLLYKNNINCIVDVRSTPYSKYSSQFNREDIKLSLKEHNIYYIYMGDKLGARYNNEALYNNSGIVDFKKVRSTNNFQEGIDRLNNGLEKDFNIALMCTEKNPLDCHRTILVAYQLVKIGLNIYHILEDGSLRVHNDLEKDLIRMYYSKNLNLFTDDSAKEILEKAYQMRNMEIGYSINNLKVSGDN